MDLYKLGFLLHYSKDDSDVLPIESSLCISFISFDSVPCSFVSFTNTSYPLLEILCNGICSL